MKHLIRHILILFLGISLGIAGTVYHYNQKGPPAISEDLKRISAPKLYAAYKANEEKSNRKYWNRPLEVEGIVQEVYQTSDGNLRVHLRGNSGYHGVTCKLHNARKQLVIPLEIGSSVTLQGYCFGMDKNVRLVDCVLVGKP